MCIIFLIVALMMDNLLLSRCAQNENTFTENFHRACDKYNIIMDYFDIINRTTNPKVLVFGFDTPNPNIKIGGLGKLIK
jgi:hypothetical protein